MSILSNETQSGLKDCIQNNIPSRAFRYATESKNVLSSPGAIYVGTGIKRKTIMLLDAPEWSSEEAYSVGDIVTDNGRNYKVINVVSPPTRPSSDSINWQDISIGYDSYITAVLETPNEEGCSLVTKKIELLYKDSTASSVHKVYKDSNGYLANSETAGAVVVEDYFPCWVRGDTIIRPVVIG